MGLRFKLILVVFVVAVAVASFSYLHLQQFENLPVADSVTGKLFTVPKGQNARKLVVKLLDNSTALQRLWARLYLKIHPDMARIKSGTYQFAKHSSLKDALQMMVDGREYLFSITLIEGKTWRQWQQQISQVAELQHDGFVAEDFIRQYQLNGDSLEGWLMPDTYHFPLGTPVHKLIHDAYTALTQYVQQEWLLRDGDLPFETPYQALILASIVEKETGLAEERPLIAGVFINRLRENMRLQTDPTVIYGMGEDFDGNIRRADLKTPTPYNTYVIKGLPPTPIAMVSRQAIQAVLHPEITDYLYFVAKGDGSHQFSSTLQEHNQAVKKYQLKQE